ncbi:putative RNA-directed DNA polymerase [Helianthus annuus]|nr:putative RNA-directed DNA polymerase [Helianthus annuus]KAJ0723232.1 putative RNA-directed DNA polymerase [Helianthus annuus]
MFRSDNGTEFVNNQMSLFCKNKGIIHQTTCAYTPQQNGIVERKHRHLLNMARALMFQGGLPLRFWSDYILTTVYLINRLPSSVLLGKSPYELMFKFKPSLMHLRNFGCLCFSTILDDSNKFSFCAEKCVLIGYSNVKKGYRLWSLDKKMEFYSRDVKFFETVFPFKSDQMNNQEKNVLNGLNHLNFFDSTCLHPLFLSLPMMKRGILILTRYLVMISSQFPLHLPPLVMLMNLNMLSLGLRIVVEVNLAWQRTQEPQMLRWSNLREILNLLEGLLGLHFFLKDLMIFFKQYN